MTGKFEMSREGYIEAKKYLESIGKLSDYIKSQDGYSLVYYANYCKEKADEKV